MFATTKSLRQQVVPALGDALLLHYFAHAERHAADELGPLVCLAEQCDEELAARLWPLVDLKSKSLAKFSLLRDWHAS